jgi:hypothetical protein
VIFIAFIAFSRFWEKKEKPLNAAKPEALRFGVFAM